MDDFAKVSFDIQSPGSVGFDLQSPDSVGFDLGNARATGSGGNYNQLKNKPSINNHELVGNQPAAALGLLSMPAGGMDGQYLVKASAAPGGARWADLPTYSPTAETWTVTPLVGAETTLATAGKYLDRNIQVEAIPYAEVTNVSGGKTATIGG